MQENNTGPSPLPTETIDESMRPRRTLFDRIRAARAWLLIFGAIVIVGVAVISWIMFGASARQSPADVVLAIDVKPEITSGSESEFAITYENRDRHELRNIFLEMSYPSNLRIISSSLASRDGEGRNFDLPDMPSAGRGKLLLRAIATGTPNEIKSIQARLFYTLANTKATFNAQAEAKISLRAPDFNFHITAPTEVISSQKVEYHLTFQNVASRVLDRMQIRLTLPAGFEVLTVTPPPSSADHQTWDFSRIQAGEEHSLVIVGRFAGAAGEEKLLRAELGVVDGTGTFVLQNSSSFSLRLVESSLKLRLQSARANATVLPGENLQFTLTYSNTGLRAFNNVQLGVRLQGQAVERGSVRAGSGVLIGQDLLWNAASFAPLALIQPGKQGSMTFSFSARADFAAVAIKNPAVTMIPYLSSYELPDPVMFGGQNLQTKSSVTVITAVESLGGEPARYRITWRLGGAFNDMRNVALQGVVNIPVVVFDPDSISPEQRSEITYLPSSGKVIWRVGELAAFASKEIAFTVSVSSASDTFARTLVKSLEVSGFDTFVSQEIVPPSVGDIVVPQNR